MILSSLMFFFLNVVNIFIRCDLLVEDIFMQLKKIVCFKCDLEKKLKAIYGRKTCLSLLGSLCTLMK